MSSTRLFILESEMASFEEAAKIIPGVTYQKSQEVFSGRYRVDVDYKTLDQLFLLGKITQVNVIRETINPVVGKINVSEAIQSMAINFFSRNKLNGQIMYMEDMMLSFYLEGNFTAPKSFGKIRMMMEHEMVSYSIRSFQSIYLPEIDKTNFVSIFKST